MFESSENSAVYFDSVAHTYFQAYQQKTAGAWALRVRKERVLDLFDKHGGKVLDVGCGPGVIVAEMLASGCEFWGVDGSVKMIEECRRNFSGLNRAHFSVGDATALPFPSEFFDAVICMGVVDRIPRHEWALREIVRVLNKCGTLIIAVPNLLGPCAFWRNFVFSPVVALLRPIYFGVANKSLKPTMGPFARLHRKNAYTKLVAACGCRITAVVYFNFNLLFSPLDEFFPGLALWVANKAERLRFGKLAWLGGGFIVKAKKAGDDLASS